MEGREGRQGLIVAQDDFELLISLSQLSKVLELYKQATVQIFYAVPLTEPSKSSKNLATLSTHNLTTPPCVCVCTCAVAGDCARMNVYQELKRTRYASLYTVLCLVAWQSQQLFCLCALTLELQTRAILSFLYISNPNSGPQQLLFFTEPSPKPHKTKIYFINVFVLG